MLTIYIITFLITLFFSLGVQTLFFIWFKLVDHKNLEHQHVFDYMSGIIGDGILVPLLSVFAMKTILELRIHFDLKLVILAFLAGVITTFIFHLGQSFFNLTNWTMTKKGNWNWLGLYHAIFMFFESSFLLYALFMFFKYTSRYSDIFYSPLAIGLGILLLFSMTFIYDYWKPLFRKLFV